MTADGKFTTQTHFSDHSKVLTLHEAYEKCILNCSSHSKFQVTLHAAGVKLIKSIKYHLRYCVGNAKVHSIRITGKFTPKNW